MRRFAGYVWASSKPLDEQLEARREPPASKANSCSEGSSVKCTQQQQHPVEQQQQQRQSSWPLLSRAAGYAGHSLGYLWLSAQGSNSPERVPVPVLVSSLQPAELPGTGAGNRTSPLPFASPSNSCSHSVTPAASEAPTSSNATKQAAFWWLPVRLPVWAMQPQPVSGPSPSPVEEAPSSGSPSPSQSPPLSSSSSVSSPTPGSVREGVCVASGSAAWWLFLRAQVARTTEQRWIVQEAIMEARRLLAQHPKADLKTVRGWLVELHHAVTYNRDSVRKGLSLRAEIVDGQTKVDIRVRDTSSGEVVAEAQSKFSGCRRVLTETVRDVNYEGQQLVVPTGIRPVPGTTARLTAGGVSSSSLTLVEGDHLAANSEAHFAALHRPDPVIEALRNGAVAAGVGAGVGAAQALLAAVVQRGSFTKLRLDEGDGKAVTEGAVLGAAAAGAAAVVGTLTESAALGGLSAGAVGTVYSVLKCGGAGASCRTREAVGGAAGVTVGVGAAALCGAALPAGPAAAVVCPLAAFGASFEARRLAAAVMQGIPARRGSSSSGRREELNQDQSFA